MAFHIQAPREQTFEKNGIRLKLRFSDGFNPKFNAAFERTQKMFDYEVAKKMDPYVPMRTGTLKNSVRTASQFGKGILVYNTPYAAAQYYLHPSGTGIHDGLRGSYWGQRCIADNKQHLEKFAQDAARRNLE